MQAKKRSPTRSAASSGSKPPEPLTYFLDESLDSLSVVTSVGKIDTKAVFMCRTIACSRGDEPFHRSLTRRGRLFEVQTGYLLCRCKIAIIGDYPLAWRSPIDTAKLFSSGRSQAVRLPKQYRFEGDSVLIKRVGRAVVLLPRAGTWESLREALEMFEPGLKLVREQPARTERRRALKR